MIRNAKILDLNCPHIHTKKVNVRGDECVSKLNCGNLQTIKASHCTLSKGCYNFFVNYMYVKLKKQLASLSCSWCEGKITQLFIIK